MRKCCLIGALILLIGPIAHAQATRPDTLSPIAVTVLRIPLDATVAPLNVLSVGPRDIATAQPGFSIDEALGQVSGVQVDNRLNFAIGERISIRGIGARSAFGTRGVRVIVDGIPSTLADGQSALSNIDMGSLGAAEIIRGPASALYGNSSAGVVSFRTLPPPPVAFAPTARVMTGSDGLIRAQIGAGGIVGRGTYVLNAGRLDFGGYRAYSAARNAHANGVATWDWDRVSVKLVANGVRYSAENPGSLSEALIKMDRRQAYANNLLHQTGERGRQNQVGLSTQVSIGAGELQLAGYGLTRAINNPIPASIIGLHRAAGGARATYSITAGGATRHVTALVGGETALQRDDRRNWVNANGIAGPLSLDQRERVTSESPFVQVSALVNRFTFLGGVRYDQFRFAAKDHFITPTNPDDSGIRRLWATSPTAGLSYAVLPAVSIYGNVATAFQTPTTTELTNRPSGAGGFNPELEPERTHARELGVRGRTASMSYSIAFYDMRIDNELIPFQVASAPDRQFFRNAGVARHRGIDVDFSAQVASAVRMNSSYSFTNARYVRYAVSGGNGVTSYATNRVPGVAPNIGSLALQLGNPANRFIAVEERYRSNIPVNDANTVSSPASIVTNLRGTIRFGRMSVFSGIDNLFAEVYNTSVSINGFGGRYFDPAAGRTVYAGLDLSSIGR